MNYKKLKKIVIEYIPVIETTQSQFILEWKRWRRKYIAKAIEIDIINSDTDYKFSALTHEFGHYLSWQKGQNSKRIKDYHEAMILSGNISNIKILSDKQKLLIIREEKRAWKEGMDFVKSKNFKLNYDFHIIKRYGISHYYEKLGVKENNMLLRK